MSEVTENEINEALETRFDGMGCYLIAKEYLKIEAENKRLKRLLKEASEDFIWDGDYDRKWELLSEIKEALNA